MPLYDIEHVIFLSDEQQEALAKAFTMIHCQRFKTPSFFINVRFNDVSSQKVYRGGVLRKYNRAILRTRAGENRTKEIYGEHCHELIKAWNEVVINQSEQNHQQIKEDRSLRTLWVLGALTTAVEMGIQRPSAGEEIGWLKEHKNEFKRLADGGDEDMQGLMQELETRQEFSGVL